METLCPSVESNSEVVHDELTLGGILRWAPRSCGNRHCPRCLAAKSWQWLEKQTQSLLPITYYHCVFTLPAELNSLMLANQRRLYPLLFDCAAQSLLEFGHNRLHGDLGITAVLHTWGQKLDFHPHLHCIVTGGALSPDGRQWRSPKQRKFLFPVRAFAALFRGKFLAGLRQMLDAEQLHLPDSELETPVSRARWFRAALQQALDPLCQTSLWRTSAGLKLPG